MRIDPDEQAATHGGRFRPRYEARQQHSTAGGIERRFSEGLTPEQSSTWRGNHRLTGPPHWDR